MILVNFSRKEQVLAAVSTELDHIWSQIKTELSATVEEPIFRIWIEPLRALDLDRDSLVLEAPTQTYGWTRERFGRVLQACAAAVLGPAVTVDIVERGAKRRQAGAPPLRSSHPRPCPQLALSTIENSAQIPS